MQSASREMLGWVNHKLESRLPGEISINSDDITLMAESQEELKKLLMKMKEESEKGGLKLNIQKTKIMIHLVLSLDGKLMGVKMEVATDFIFLGSKITTDSDCSHEIKRHLLFGRKAMINLLLLLLSRFSRV